MKRLESIKTSRPLVSVFIKTYNSLKYIDECLSSILHQTYSPLEIVITDDCSTDGTFERIAKIVAEYRANDGKHSIIVHRNIENVGIALNCQKGIELCNGELCVQSDGDDIHLPNRVERIVDAWLKTGRRATVIWNGWHEIDGKGRLVGLNHHVGHCDFPPTFGAVMTYKRDAVVGFASVNNNFGYYDDAIFPFRARMHDGAKALVIDEALTIYRLGGISRAGP